MSKFREFIPEYIPHQKYHKVSFNSKELEFPVLQQDINQITIQKYRAMQHTNSKHIIDIRSIAYAALSVR
jgi:hypothetical protein